MQVLAKKFDVLLHGGVDTISMRILLG